MECLTGRVGVGSEAGGERREGKVREQEGESEEKRKSNRRNRMGYRKRTRNMGNKQEVEQKE